MKKEKISTLYAWEFEGDLFSWTTAPLEFNKLRVLLCFLISHSKIYYRKKIKKKKKLEPGSFFWNLGFWRLPSVTMWGTFSLDLVETWERCSGWEEQVGFMRFLGKRVCRCSKLFFFLIIVYKFPWLIRTKSLLWHIFGKLMREKFIFCILREEKIFRGVI